jgi:tetratricopeptide (TPR) repeat protein
MPASWSSRSVFVSSTFEDMHAERDHLARYVFPALEERLREHRVFLEFADLRWGVETASLHDAEAKQALVLKVCFGEIDRCRPFFVCLLGDRYGWMPPGERVRAAAVEAAFEIDAAPRSMTALEIEYAALASGRSAKSLFYFREPLPYEQMDPQIRDKYTDAASNPDGYARLQELKARISQEHAVSVRPYKVGWDPARNRPIELEAFGALVAEDLWRHLGADLKTILPAEGEVDWRQVELATLQGFIDERAQQARGREKLIDRLLSKLTGDSTAIVLSGEAGLGKSSVFACLVRALQEQHPDAQLLTHSAAISQRSASVDAMLERWCWELETTGKPERPVRGAADRKDSARDNPEASFFGLLKDAAANRKVILLIDGLDQFENTARAVYLKWLPAPHALPANVALFATGRPSPGTAILQTRQAEAIDLEPLDPADGRLIVEAISQERHKTISRAVEEALFEKHNGSQIAAGNPLWLSLVLNELLVLDADDFAELSAMSGSPDERLDALLVQTVKRIPAQGREAYKAVFARVARAFGPELVEQMLCLVGVSRYGLRELDLRVLVPRWNGTSFAAVRRALRAHLSFQGPMAQWNFINPQARRALLEAFIDEPSRIELHRRLTRYVLKLPDEDPLHEETMYHLLEGRDAQALGEYWLASDTRDAGSQALKDFLMPNEDSAARVAFVLEFLKCDTGEPAHAQFVTNLKIEWMLKFMEDVRLAHSSMDITQGLLRGLAGVLENMLPSADKKPARAATSRDVAVLCRIYRNLAMLLEDRIEAIALLESTDRLTQQVSRMFKDKWEELKQSEQGKPDGKNLVRAAEIHYDLNERDRMLDAQRLAVLLRQQGELDRAMTAAEQAIAIGRYFVGKHPGSELADKDMVFNYITSGDVAFEKGNFNQAEQYFTTAVEVAETAIKRQANDEIQDLAIRARMKVAATLLEAHEVRAAVEYVALAFQFLRESAEANPEDVPRQIWFLQANDRIANLIAVGGNLEAVDQCYQNTFRTCERMLRLGQAGETVWQHLHRFFTQRALIMEILGSNELMAAYLRSADEIAQRQAQGPT